MLAGRVTPHAEVKAWLEDLAAGKVRPPPKSRKSVG
jgi:predicted transcriptional regulator